MKLASLKDEEITTSIPWLVRVERNDHNNITRLQIHTPSRILVIEAGWDVLKIRGSVPPQREDIRVVTILRPDGFTKTVECKTDDEVLKLKSENDGAEISVNIESRIVPE